MQLLAPNDDAFAVYGINHTNLDELNQTALKLLVQYHLVEGELGSSTIVENSPLRTGYTGEGAVTVKGADGAVTVTDAVGTTGDIVAPDLTSSNGVIHGISSVLMPFSEDVLKGNVDTSRSTPDDGGSNNNVEIAAISAGVAAALILVAAAIAVHKRRQADAAKPPQVAPDDGGWGGAGRATAVHPA